MKDLMYFADNFNLHTLKKNKNERRVEGNEKTLLKKGVFIIVISNKEEEETNELETLIVTKIDHPKIQSQNNNVLMSPHVKNIYMPRTVYNVVFEHKLQLQS
jgi:hypothetical protein